MSSILKREPVAVVGLITSLATTSLPIMIEAGVPDRIVTVVGVAVGGFSAALIAFLRGAVTPNSNVALTHDQAAALAPVAPTEGT